MDADAGDAQDVKPVIASPNDSGASGPSQPQGEPMDSDLADDAGQPQVAENSAPSQPPAQSVNDTNQLNIEEKTAYERLNFNLNLELADAKEKVVSISTKNNELQEQIKIHVKEIGERSRLYTQLENSRNAEAQRAIALETEVTKLKFEKEERDANIKILNRDKQILATESLSLKDELKNCSGEKSKLELQLHNVEQDTRNLAMEKEWRKTDKQFYEDSKKWFLEELTKKDVKLTQLNLEMAGKSTQWQNERLDISRELAALQAKIVDLDAQVVVRQEALDRVTANIERQAEVNRNELRNLELSVKTKDDLANLYKEQLERAELCAAQLEEQVLAREQLIQQTKVVLEDVRKEVEDEKSVFLDQLAEKDVELLQLREDLDRANDLLRNKHAVSLNITEEELAEACPAAAETTRLLKGGTSLTSLVREHSILAGELTSEKAKTAELEKAFRDVVADIEAKAPMFLNQKEKMEKLYDENERLTKQLTDADVVRTQVESNRDQAMRELAFTRAELEKFQRDYSNLSKKHHHTLFVLQKLQNPERDTDSPPMTEEDQSQLYDSIGQLQKRNMQLESELATERASASQALINSHNQELDVLRQELITSQQSEQQLSLQLAQLTDTFTTMKEQSEKLRELVEDDSTAAQARDLKLRAEEYLADLNVSKLAVARLEGSVAAVKDEKKASDTIYEQRLNNQQTLIDELHMTKSKLEAKFEQQRQVAMVNYKDLESAEREKARVEKENAQLRASDSENARRLSEMHQQVVDKNNEVGDLKIQYTVANEELKRASAEVAGLNAQLKVYKNQRLTDQHLLGSINELSNRLSRVQAERESRFVAQLDVVQIERDQLKRDAARMTETISQSRTDAKTVKTRLEQEITLLKLNISEKDEQIQLGEVTLLELRSRLAALQSELINDGSTEEMSPERLRKECQQLKNRVQFLESQCEERKVQLDAVKAEVSRRDAEAQKMEDHSGKMESGLKDIQNMATMEREILEARASAAERRSNELVEQVAQLRTALDNMEAENSSVKLAAVQVQGDLQIKIDVKEQQLLDLQNRIAILDERLTTMEAENNNNQALLETLRADAAQADARVEETRLHIDVLTTKLRTKENDCMLAEDSARMAEESRQAAAQALEARNQQADEAEAKWAAAVAEHDERLKHIMGKYDEVISQLGSPNDLAAMETGSSDAVINPELPQAVIQSLQNVIDFLRKEKEESVMRAMDAEVDARRLRAEAFEAQAARNELVAKVNSLQTAAAVAEQVTVEKAELLKKLETMTVTQQQYQRLCAEKEKLVKLINDAQKLASGKDQQLLEQKKQFNEINVKHAAAHAEVEKKNKEIETLRQSLQQQQGRLPTQRVAEAKTEQVQAQLTQTQAEQQQAMAKIATLEKNLAESRQKFEQTRQLAVKYRNDLQKLRAEKGVTASTSSTEVSETTKAEIEALQKEKKELQEQIDAKSNDLLETGFRLNLLSSKLEKLEGLKIKMEEEKAEMQAKIQKLEQQHSLALPSTADTPAPSLATEPMQESSSQELAAVDTLDETETKCSEAVSPPDAGLNVDIETAVASGSFTTSSTVVSPNIRLFGRSNPSLATASSSSTIIPNIFGGSKTTVDTSNAQNDTVSGSLASVEDMVEENPNDSAGESRDSTVNAPVSSTEGSRKRPAGGSVSQGEVKRQRESSNEAVTSSEERIEQREPIVVEDDAGFIPDPFHADQQNDDDDEDIIPLDPPNRGGEYLGELEDENVAYDEEDGDDEDEEELEIPDSDDDEDEGASEMDEDSDDSENSGEDEGDGVQPPAIGEIEVIGDSDTDNQEDDEDRNIDAGQDEEVLGADDNSRSQPILDDQDREAASAMEEADDEGRVSADGGIMPGEAAQPAPSGPRIRVPIKFDREDQCSSSNESGSTPQASRPQMARRGGSPRGPARGGRAGGQQLYTAGRGLGTPGRGRGRGKK